LRAERSFAKALDVFKVGFYPFREPDASFTLFQRTTTSQYRLIRRGAARGSTLYCGE
jgi:hypothetical protein